MRSRSSRRRCLLLLRRTLPLTLSVIRSPPLLPDLEIILLSTQRSSRTSSLSLLFFSISRITQKPLYSASIHLALPTEHSRRRRTRLLSHAAETQGLIARLGRSGVVGGKGSRPRKGAKAEAEAVGKGMRG
jgi:hypothetical protein